MATVHLASDKCQISTSGGPACLNTGQGHDEGESRLQATAMGTTHVKIRRIGKGRRKSPGQRASAPLQEGATMIQAPNYRVKKTDRIGCQDR